MRFMIIERLKSVILFFLITLSLYLTYQLWYGLKPADPLLDDVYERIIIEEPRTLDSIVNPSLVAVSLGGESYYVFGQGQEYFNIYWNFISHTLRDIQFAPVSYESLDIEDKIECATLYFNLPLPIGTESIWLKSAPDHSVAKIEILKDEESSWLLLHEEQNRSKLLLQIPEDKDNQYRELVQDLDFHESPNYKLLSASILSDQLERRIDLRQPVYVPTDEIFMSKLFIKPESIDKEMLLKTFFVDYKLARIIEERDGSLIYTDGDRGLRLKDNSFDYSYPKREEGRSSHTYIEALLYSSNLVGYHGGWADDVILENLSVSGWGRELAYTAELRTYYKGYPLLVRKPTRVVFNDSGVVHFNRSLYRVLGEINSEENGQSALSWEEALKKSIELFDYGVGADRKIPKVEIMKLGFVIIKEGDDYYGIPTWLIQLNGNRYYIEANKLSVLDEEDIL